MNNHLKIEKYLRKNKLGDQKITELARNIGVSHSAIVRYCNHLGYAGYKEFKFHHKQSDWKQKYYENKIIQNNILYSLVTSFKMLDLDNIAHIAQVINKYKKVTIIADGFASYVGLTFKRLLRKINIDAELIRAAGDIHFIIPQKRTIFFFISFSGQNQNFIRAVKKINHNQKRAILFSLTSGNTNNIEKYANGTIKNFIIQDVINIREYPVAPQIVCHAIIGILFEQIYALEKTQNDGITSILLNRNK